MIIGAAVSDFQVSFNGVTFGPGTPYDIVPGGMVGFTDLSPVRAEFVSRPGRSGAFAQPHYADGATFDLSLEVYPTATVAFADAVAALRAAVRVQEAVTPLTWKLPGSPVLTVGAQPLARKIVVEDGYNTGVFAPAAVQWYAPDPRMYGQAQTVSTGLRGAGGGLVYPLTYPLSYGAPASGGSLAFTNTGWAQTEPIFTVSGPLAVGFQITYVETGQHLTYSAPVGSDIVIDCGLGTASTQGQDRTVNLSQRDWFSVPGGSSATFVLATLGTETPVSAPSVLMTCQFAPAFD